VKASVTSIRNPLISDLQKMAEYVLDGATVWEGAVLLHEEDGQVSITAAGVSPLMLLAWLELAKGTVLQGIIGDGE